ncbi:MAG: RNA-binding cell elongation regulator Jag/EloR [Candidatus Limnocylindrales bacterium]
MSEYQEFTGKTVEDAIRQAREAFGVGGLNDLDFEILTPGSRGVLGMGAEPARIIAAPKTALGGAAPRREPSAAPPPSATPPEARREDRGRGDRGRDRSGPSREMPATPPSGSDEMPAPAGWGGAPVTARDGGPAASPTGRSGWDVREGGTGPEGAVGSTETPGASRGREPRRDAPRRDAPRRDGPRRDAPRPDAPPSMALSQRDQDDLASARASVGAEREEMQAAEATPEALAAGKEILDRLLSLMGYDVTVAIVSGDTSKLDVSGEDAEKESLGALIGRKGERLSALQHLLNLMLSRRMGSWTRVLVDVEDYRGRRERQLQEIAARAADRVVESGVMLQLEPMPALERRWIHLALRGHERVVTQSIGEEPQRRVVILRRD